MLCPSSCSASRCPPSASRHWPAAAWSEARPRPPWATWSVSLFTRSDVTSTTMEIKDLLTVHMIVKGT